MLRFHHPGVLGLAGAGVLLQRAQDVELLGAYHPTP
jgi:hypothetical protein